MSRHTSGRLTEFIPMAQYHEQKAEYERQLKEYKCALVEYQNAMDVRFYEIFVEHTPYEKPMPQPPSEPIKPRVLKMTPGKKAARFTYNTHEAEPKARRHEKRNWKFDKNGAPTSEFKRHEIRCQRQNVQASQAFEPLDLSEEAYEREAMRLMLEECDREMHSEGYLDSFDAELVFLQDYEERRVPGLSVDPTNMGTRLTVHRYSVCTWQNGRTSMDVCTCRKCKEACVEADQHTAREAAHKWVERGLAQKRLEQYRRLREPVTHSRKQNLRLMPGADAWC